MQREFTHYQGKLDQRLPAKVSMPTNSKVILDTQFTSTLVVEATRTSKNSYESCFGTSLQQPQILWRLVQCQKGRSLEEWTQLALKYQDKELHCKLYAQLKEIHDAFCNEEFLHDLYHGYHSNK